MKHWELGEFLSGSDESVKEFGAGESVQVKDIAILLAERTLLD